MGDPETRPDEIWELVLYAGSPVLDEFPPELFFDDDLVWHRQQFGLPGHLATAALVERGADLYVLNLVSDVVQRIGRQRRYKTRIENRFAGWARMLIHAVLDFALDRGSQRVLVATGDWALAHTDPGRDVQRPLFDRVYDGSVGTPFAATRAGHWWVLDVERNTDVLVRPTPTTVPLADGPWIGIAHDIERGWGHVDDDPAFAAAIHDRAPTWLASMLDLEARADVASTYNVVGILLADVHDDLRARGHCIGFHSYDHAGPGDPGADDQLRPCRTLDYRIKGYRPAQSRLTTELADGSLAFHNFEWLASSRWSLGRDAPFLSDGVVHIPILFDDFDLHRGRVYDDWESAALATLADSGGGALSLHDCYGAAWLAQYPELLRKLADLGTWRTFDDVAADLLLAHAV